MRHRRKAQPSHFETYRQRKGLTERQAEVFRLLGQGYDTDAIADELGIAPGTVKVHQRWVFHKAKVRNRTEAALMSLLVQRGLAS
jgi:DNA-binding CsgD family transcriptional regulator